MKLFEFQLTLPDIEPKTYFKELYISAENAITGEVKAGIKKLFPSFESFDAQF
jgi:superoxide dismutase